MAQNAVSVDHYPPRRTFCLGLHSLGPFRLKIYGLCASDRTMGAADTSSAQEMLAERLAVISVEPAPDQPGFAIFHIGTEGLTLSTHWWVEGCILCQDHYRWPYDGVDPIAGMRRHVVGCVWELAVINHEQIAWRHSMMGGTPDMPAYLANWYIGEP